MSTGQNRIFDEIAKLMTDAAGVAQGMRGEAETAFRAQAEKILNGFDFVKRDEFEAVKEMAANARDENDRLCDVVKKLETRISQLESGGKTTAKRASAPAAKKGSASSKSAAKKSGSTGTKKA